MFVIETDKKLTYCFKSNNSFGLNLTATGTLSELDEIATKLGITIDYAQLAKDNGLVDEFYQSEHLGIVAVKEMATEHLRNALLKQLRLYFTRENFKDIDDKDFFAHLEDPDFYDSEIKMLYEELSNRLD